MSSNPHMPGRPHQGPQSQSMQSSRSSLTGPLFGNPVYNRSFADPFVLKFCGSYWAYSTGFWHDGRCFGILQSNDLINWQELPGAMEPLPGGATCYWAPEVTYLNGRFYMYYSVGNEERMQIRVAVAERPSGPFIDSGRRLTAEDFAIDAHVFADDDGSRYLFYATDFLDHTFIGTGTVCDRMIDPFTLAGDPRPVTRARYDWQVYDPMRESKGGVRWHTVEGPFVVKRKGIYFEMFSGGNWQNVTYGVSYATSDRVRSDEEWTQACDGERVLPVLRTVPDKVIGPGHNSAVRGPNNREWFCVYHRWTDERSARVLCIDRMDWAGDRLLVLGPSTMPQPVPAAPAAGGFLPGGNNGHGGGWSCSVGSWIFRDDMAIQESVDVVAEARYSVFSPSFLMEVSLRSLENPMGNGSFGICLYCDEARVVRLLMAPGHLMISRWSQAGVEEETITFPDGIDPTAFHLLRVEVNGDRIVMVLDELAIRWEGRCELDVREIALVTQQMSASFAGFGLTLGWEDLFMEDGDPARIGWEVVSGLDGEGETDGSWYIENRELHCSGGEHPPVIMKGDPQSAYEAVINVRLREPGIAGAAYGFYPALGRHDPGPLLRIEVREGGCMLVATDSTGTRSFPLPEGFEPAIHQQFRFRKENQRLSILTEAGLLGELVVSSEPTKVGLAAFGAPVAFDMVRLTVIEPR
jgi:GH43 family beta-xylosidase